MRPGIGKIILQDLDFIIEIVWYIFGIHRRKFERTDSYGVQMVVGIKYIALVFGATVNDRFLLFQSGRYRYY